MDQFELHAEVVRSMRQDGLVSDRPIKDKGPCGYADLNLGGFFFLLADRDEVAERLVASGYKDGFLQLVAYIADKEKDQVYFHRPYHVRGDVVPLSDLPVQ